MISLTPKLSACVVLVVISRTVFNDFVHDDIPAIVRNPDVQGSTGIFSIFKNDFWGTPMSELTSHKSYRPLTVLSYRLNRTIFGSLPFWFHLINIFLHSWLVFRLHNALVKFGHAESTAFLASVLFGLHPINSESVANNVGRAEVLSAHFILSSIIYREDTVISGTSALLAMLCKEGGVFCLAILVALELIVLLNHRRRGELVFDTDFLLYFIYKMLFWFSFLLVFISLRLWVLNGTYPVFTPPDNPARFTKDSFMRWATTMFYWVQHYWLLFSPKDLAYDWAYGSIPLIKSIGDSRIYSIVSLFFLVIIVGVCCLRSLFDQTARQLTCPQRILLPTLLLFIPFIPASNVLVTVGFAVAERVMYTPSIGFAIIIANGFEKIALRNTLMRQTLIILTILLFTIKTNIRISSWSKKDHLFRAGLTVHRHNAKMFYNYANVLRNNQKLDEAILFYEEAIRLHPKYSKAYDNIGVIFDDGTEEGSKKAERMYQKSIEANPHHPSAYSNLASLYAQSEKLQEAVKVLLSVQNYDIPYYTATLKLALIMKRRGFDRDAEQLYQHILLLFKNSKTPIAEPYNHYGALLTEQKRYEEAIKVYEQAISLEPLNPNPLVNLAWVKQTIGFGSNSTTMVNQAEELYERSLRLRQTPEALMRLGSLKYQRGDIDGSKAEYEKARRIDPNNHLLLLEQSIVLVSSGEINRAVKLLEESIQTHDPSCKIPNLHLTLAKIYGPRKHQYMKAASYLESCHRQMETNNLEKEEMAEIKFQLGAIYHEIVRNNQNVSNPTKNEVDFLENAKNKTLQLLKEAIKMKPGDAEYRVLLAQVHLRSGNIEDGTEVLKTVLRLKPDHEIALILMNRVTSRTA